MKKNPKVDSIIRSGKQTLKTLELQGFDAIVFSALFYRNGKKLNSVEKADVTNFSKVVRNYYETENPDKIKIEFFNADANTILWSKEFNVSDTSVQPVSLQGTFQGFGEAEINEIVGRKISDYEKIREVEELRNQLEQLTAENDELRGDLEETTAQLDSKRQMEYYAGLLGMAMPGLAKVLGKTQVGQTLGFLSGIEEEPKQLESTEEPTDQRSLVIQKINEYLQSLDNPTLGKIYSILCNFSSDSSAIQVVSELLS